MPIFVDVGEITTRAETPEGFLSVVADFARTGIQEYHAGELIRKDLPPQFQDDPHRIIRILRPAQEVFEQEAMKSFGQRPVTNNHPASKVVDKKNFKRVVVGTSKHKVERNDDKLRVGLVIQDADAIEDVKRGKDRLSAGYSASLVWDSGTDPLYGPYDAIQTQIRGNHIAVVDSARGGPEIRINDSWPSATKPKDKPKMAERKINGIAIEFTDQGAQAVDHILAETKKVSDEVATLRTQIADANKKAEKLQGELDAQKAAQLTDEQIEAKITERLNVIDAARKLYPDVETANRSLTEIKVAAITHVDKNRNLEGKSADYVDGMFETFVAKAPDKSRASMRQATQHADAASGTQTPPDIAGDAQREFAKRNATAWQFEKGGEA